MANRIWTVIGAVVVFCVGFIVASIYQSARPPEDKFGRTYEVSEIVGMQVRSPEGEEWAKISDFVIDTNGHVAFTLLSYGEKVVAVPFGTLSYNSEGKHLVLNTTRDRLESTPAFTKGARSDWKGAEDIYRHFGQQPYWSEDGMIEREEVTDFPD